MTAALREPRSPSPAKQVLHVIIFFVVASRIIEKMMNHLEEGLGRRLRAEPLFARERQ